MLKNLKPPYLGVAYYPEDWPESEIDFDIRRMKELGINVVRIAEFAWHRMEPKMGSNTVTPAEASRWRSWPLQG